MGINGPGISNTNYVDHLANRAPMMGPWQSGGVNVAIDAFGNPTVASAQSYFTQSKLGVDGVYNFAFNSTAAVTLTPAFGSTYTNVVFSGGLTTGVWTIPKSMAGPGSNIPFSYSGATGGIQNLIISRVTESLVYSPTAIGTWAGPTGQITAATYRTLIPAGTVVRFMDWMRTPFNLNGTWSNRTLPAHTNYSMATIGFTGPWEFVIKMANELQAHPWINIPVNAIQDPTYLTNLANMFKYGSDGVNPYTSVQSNPVWPPLASNLNVYVEYANELWNTVQPLFVATSLQTATGTIPLTGLSVAGGFNANIAIYQGASLGAATWKALVTGNNIAGGATSGTVYVFNQSGTYAPGALTINTATPTTATGGAIVANTDAVTTFLDTTYPNDFYGNIYRKHGCNTLLMSEAFRTAFGSIDMPENNGRVRPLLMAQLGFDSGPLSSMFSVMSVTQVQSGLTIPTITTRAANNYLYGMGCSYYYYNSYTSAAVTAANAVATGTSIGLTYTTPLTTAFPVGTTVTVSGLTITGFTSGNYVLTASSTTGCTFASAATAGASTTAGTVTFVPSTVEDLFGPFNLYPYSSFTQNLAATSRWAASFGVQFCSYEGWLSLTPFPTIYPEYASLTDSRLIPKLLNFQNAFDAAGGDVACAFTIDATSTSPWSMVTDQRNPTNSSKYVGWLATMQVPRANATAWPARGTTIPGAAYAARLDSTGTVSPWLTTPQPTGGLTCSNGYWPVYVWYCQDKIFFNVVASITCTVAGTASTYVNGDQGPTLSLTVGTANYSLTYSGEPTKGPLSSASIHFLTGSGGVINTIQMQ